jgi:hypothetical protein
MTFIRIVGQSLDYKNLGDLVPIRLSNGREIIAIAQTEINSTKLLVAEVSPGHFLCWSETHPAKIHEEIEGFRNIPEEEVTIVEQENIYPFQVIFFLEGQVYLGGDRETQILGYENLLPLISGINNLGNLDYLIPTTNLEVITLDNSGAIETFSFINSPPSTIWIGGGYLYSNIIREELESPTSNTENTGESFPILVPIPFHPNFNGIDSGVRIGTEIVTEQSNNGGYVSTISRSWDYNVSVVGSTPLPTPNPDIFTIPLVCNFTTSGINFTWDYTRTSEIAWEESIEKSINLNLKIWLNENEYEGIRTESRQENLQILKNRAIFTTGTTFGCVRVDGGAVPPEFGLYQWQEISNTSVNYSGETTTETKVITEDTSESITIPITLEYEKEWLKNTSFVSNVVQESVLPSQGYTINAQFATTTLYPVDGNKTSTVTSNYTESYSYHFPLLNSGDNLAIARKEETGNTTINISENKEENITRFLRNDSDDTPTTAIYVQTKTVVNNANIYFFVESLSEVTDEVSENPLTVASLNLDDNFYCFVKPSTINPTLGSTLSLSNEDSSFLFSRLLNKILNYTRVENFVTEEISYTEINSDNNPFWENLTGMPVYFLWGDLRYTCIVASYTFSDETNPENPEILRNVNSIELNILNASSYPNKIANEEVGIIYTIENCANFLLFLLENEKQYFNLVFSEQVLNFYFAKEVLSDLSAEEHYTEIYQIVGSSVVQQEPVSGPFFPVTPDTAIPIGISYYPT